jgi:hypothetical protein
LKERERPCRILRMAEEANPGIEEVSLGKHGGIGGEIRGRNRAVGGNP